MTEVKLEGKLFREIQVASADIDIRRIRVRDLWQSLQAGYDDFNANPSFGVFLILIYPLSALLFSLFMLSQQLNYLIFPLVAGFTLLGPMACVALFEMSRRRQLGLNPHWRDAFEFIHTSAYAPIIALSLLMMLLYVCWLFMAQFIYFGLYGVEQPTTLTSFITELLNSRRGAALMLYGSGVGLVFAFVALAVSVVAFPLLLDKPVSAATAVAVSFRAVVGNPLAMGLWGLAVVLMLGLGTLVFLIGLAVVLPIIGHATWHLYRRVVVHDR